MEIILLALLVLSAVSYVVIGEELKQRKFREEVRLREEMRKSLRPELFLDRDKYPNRSKFPISRTRPLKSKQVSSKLESLFIKCGYCGTRYTQNMIDRMKELKCTNCGGDL